MGALVWLEKVATKVNVKHLSYACNLQFAVEDPILNTCKILSQVEKKIQIVFTFLEFKV